VWWDDREPADLDQRYHHELLPSYQSTAELSAQRFQRMKVMAMPEVLATPAVAMCSLAELVNTEMVVLLAVFDPSAGSIVEAPAPFGLSNYVSCYPNEENHCYDCHSCFRVVGSHSYYSLIILIYSLCFGPNNFAFIRLPVKNDLAAWIHGKGSMYYERINDWLLTDVPIQAS
jgi:hypothetical protein